MAEPSPLHADAGEQEMPELNVDAPAFVPCSPPNRTTGNEDPSVPSGAPAAGPAGNRGFEEPSTPVASHLRDDAMGLHVDVPVSNTVDVLRILDHVPFTPSQGIRTPSPRNKAALRSAAEGGEPVPSRFSTIGAQQLVMPHQQPLLGESPPFSPTKRALQFDHHFLQPSAPFSPTYTAASAVMNDFAVSNRQMANGVPGQTLHQMYFGFSHSPPSSPSQTAPYSHFWGQTATTPVSHNPVMAPGSPTAHVGGHGLGATSSMPMFTQLPVYAAAHTPQMLTGIIASPFPQHHGMQTVFGADYSMAQAYQMAGMQSAPAPISLNPMNTLGHQASQMNPIRRSHNSRFWSGGSPVQSSRHLGRPPHPQQPHPRPMQVPRQVAVSHKSSNDSSPNTSTSGSPVREASTSAGPDGKPRMNARQRRTERRRREREIKAIQDHVDAGQAALGGVLLGEERRLYDFQMSEVKSLMAQVQAQQQDNGEGVLIEYHLRKLRELVRLEEPDASIPDGAASTSSSPAMGASGGEGQASPGVDHSVSDLEASFEKQRLTDYQSDSKVLPANPMRGTECSEEGSPMHPSTPDQQIQAQPQMV